MIYEIVYTSEATKQIRKLPPKDAKRIVGIIKSFESNPRPFGYKKLVGWSDFFRYRVGDYRIIYKIIDSVLTVTVVEVKRRNESTY